MYLFACYIGLNELRLRFLHDLLWSQVIQLINESWKECAGTLNVRSDRSKFRCDGQGQDADLSVSARKSCC